ncbi:hypothetical protein HK098_007085 [Nowakowskiella sp. JEL0407]|nr:hypothetical protein HK098_007085 [Nowakowskiella sp. JEL0407]
MFGNADLRLTKSNSNTGTISIKTAAFISIPAPQITTDDNKYLFKIDPTSGVLSSFSFIAFNPPCLLVIAEISLPKSNQNLLTIENDDGPTKFTSVGDEVLFKSINLSSDNGKVTIEGGLPATNVSLKADNGEIVVLKVLNSALGLKLKSDTGKITIDGLTASTLDVGTDNGEISLNATAIDMVTAKSDDGKITANWSGKSIKAQSDHGAIDVAIPGAVEHVAVDLKSDNGAIKLDLSKSFKGNLDLKTSTGQVQIRMAQILFCQVGM